MLPYDESPGGNALGIMYDEESRRINRQMFETHIKQPFSAPQTWLQTIAYFVAATIILFVMVFGSLG